MSEHAMTMSVPKTGPTLREYQALAERVAALEKEVAELKLRAAPTSTRTD